MKLIVRLKTKSWWFKTGLLLGVLHLLFMVWIFLEIYTGEAQWQFAWLLPRYFDFPISLLFWYIIWPIVPCVDVDIFYVLPYSHWGDLCGFIAPLLFYTVAGTAWYVYLPVILGKASKKIAVSRTGRAVAVLLMATSVLINWAELFSVWGGYHTIYSCIGDWMLYLLPVLWILLFVWLYFFGSQRKAALWLLCLLPLLLFYPAQELYFYIKFVVPRMGG